MANVVCNAHGVQPEAFVCQHIASTLQTTAAVGFWWSAEDQSELPDAWCNDCNARLSMAGGDWTDAATAAADIKLLCGRCYDAAKAVWLHARAIEGSR